MSPVGIAQYALRASIFALAVCGVFAAARRLLAGLPKTPETRRRERLYRISVFYLAALVEITVLRGGIPWNALASAGRPAVLWSPIATTLAEYRAGAWRFIYHVAGNLAWFFPIGVLLPRLRHSTGPLRVALAGLGISMGIEALQWLLLTGHADMSDVVLNTLGALGGCIFSCGRFRPARK